MGLPFPRSRIRPHSEPPRQMWTCSIRVHRQRRTWPRRTLQLRAMNSRTHRGRSKCRA
nr:hypothetical protein [uncultured bacterium]